VTRLSVVLGTYNRLESLKRCIASVFAQTRTPSVVYVTDAGSTDGTVEYLRSIASERLVPVLVGQKLGQARAYNDVFATVTTPYVVWISDDNEIVNGGLDLGVQILDELPRVGMVAIKVTDVEGPSVDAPYIGAVSSIGVLNVNQGMLRTPTLQQAGGFSERFRDYGIDPDLTAKVLFSGWDIAYTRAIGIHHYRAWADGSESGEAQRARQRAYTDLYSQTWSSQAPPDRIWKARRKLWSAFQKWTGLTSTSSDRVLGMDGRDWCNVLSGRYISPLDPLLYRGKPYYLLQHAPTRKTSPRTPLLRGQ
jgi:GT2 family glycosyltransferase